MKWTNNEKYTYKQHLDSATQDELKDELWDRKYSKPVLYINILIAILIYIGLCGVAYAVYIDYKYDLTLEQYNELGDASLSLRRYICENENKGLPVAIYHDNATSNYIITCSDGGVVVRG